MLSELQGLYPLRQFFNQYYINHFYFKPKTVAWEYSNNNRYENSQKHLANRFRAILNGLTELGILERYNKSTYRKVL